MSQNEGNGMCAVCLSTINEKESYKLECGHVFHTNCIVQWFRNSNGNCPCCWDNKKKISAVICPFAQIEEYLKDGKRNVKEANNHNLFSSID